MILSNKTFFETTQPYSRLVEVGGIMGHRVFVEFDNIEDEDDAVFQYHLIIKMLTEAFK